MSRNAAFTMQRCGTCRARSSLRASVFGVSRRSLRAVVPVPELRRAGGPHPSRKTVHGPPGPCGSREVARAKGRKTPVRAGRSRTGGGTPGARARYGGLPRLPGACRRPPVRGRRRDGDDGT
ncbi:hypothetical protein GZL_03310 [Streptomyces sp. 769]|nr:hypothetical protein GZL_03310 [Streptomyces sp. 769]